MPWKTVRVKTPCGYEEEEVWVEEEPAAEPEKIEVPVEEPDLVPA